MFQENKTRQIFRKKRTFLTPLLRTRVRIRELEMFVFFGKFDVFSFLETRVLRFALLPYYQHVMKHKFFYKRVYLSLFTNGEYLTGYLFDYLVDINRVREGAGITN